MDDDKFLEANKKYYQAREQFHKDQNTRLMKITNALHSVGVPPMLELGTIRQMALTAAWLEVARCPLCGGKLMLIEGKLKCAGQLNVTCRFRTEGSVSPVIEYDLLCRHLEEVE